MERFIQAPTASLTELDELRKCVSELRSRLRIESCANETLRHLAEGLASRVGDDFFQALVRHLAKTLHVAFAFVGEQCPDATDCVRSIVWLANGELSEPFVYNLRDTPCENVVARETCVYPRGVQQRFPRDALLKKMGAESYAATPMIDSRQQVIGLVAVSNGDPFENPDLVEFILKIFAVRASAELERRQAEATLEKTRNELEIRIAERTADLAKTNKSLRREIGERKLAEEINRRLATIVEQCEDGIVSTTPDGCIVTWNKAAERIYGYTATEAIGNGIWMVIPPERMQEAQDVIEKVASGVPVDHLETVQLRKDGSLVHVDLSMSAIRDARGQLIGRSGIVRDISRRIEEERRAMIHQAELAHAARLTTMGEMASGIAHELNQPLCAITSFGQACLRSLKSDEFDREVITGALQEMTEQALKASEVIRRLRRYVRRDGPQEAAVNVNDLIHEVLAFVRRELKELDVVTHLYLSDRLPPVWADAIQIEQVLLNLVRNSLDAMQVAKLDEKGLSIRTGRAQDRHVEVAVKNSGPCVPPEVLDHVFDPFFTTKQDGLGLGLSISHSIIEAHGGSMWASSTSEGTTFGFLLPTRHSRPH